MASRLHESIVPLEMCQRYHIEIIGLSIYEENVFYWIELYLSSNGLEGAVGICVKY